MQHCVVARHRLQMDILFARLDCDRVPETIDISDVEVDRLARACSDADDQQILRSLDEKSVRSLNGGLLS